MNETVTILCEHCMQPLLITAESPTIEKGLSGGLPYTRVGVICQKCAKRTKVPQTPETEALLKDRLEKESRKAFGFPDTK